MKKSILAIAAFLMVAGAITVISCNKDNEHVQKTETSSVVMKSSNGFEQMRETLTVFYTACDNAYANDPDAFLAACEANDEATFMDMTNLKPEFISNFCSIAQESLTEFSKENPEYTPYDKSCDSCFNTPLTVIGSLTSASKGHLVELIPAFFMEYDYYYMSDAIAWYSENGSEFLTAARISAHIGEYFKIIHKVSMNTEMIVAKFEGEPEEGKNLPLAFNEELFKNEIEKELKNNTSNEWVAEEVNAYWFFNEIIGEYVPVFHVSAFDVTNEKGTNIYLLSNSYHSGSCSLGTSFRLAARDVNTVDIYCEFDGDCNEQTCVLTLGTNTGKYYCDKYCSGKCDKVTRAVVIVGAICDVMHSIIKF